MPRARKPLHIKQLTFGSVGKAYTKAFAQVNNMGQQLHERVPI